MIIEDQPDAAELFAEMTRVSGFRVIKTYTSTPAMALVAQEKPDLILLDIMMPDVSRTEVFRYMHREPTLEKIPVIVVSAKSMPSDVRDGPNAGASIYLTKTVGYIDPKNTVDQMIQGL